MALVTHTDFVTVFVSDYARAVEFYGAVLGLRAVVLILCGVLYTIAVDPDEVLRLVVLTVLEAAVRTPEGDPTTKRRLGLH